MSGAGAFFRDLQQLLVAGDFASTYKYALLLALVRWAVEHPDHDERQAVDVGAFAAPFLELYFPQVQPYAVALPDAPLREVWPANVAERPPAFTRRAPRSGAEVDAAILRQDPANDLPRVLRQVLAERGRGSRSLLDVPADRRDALLRDARRAITEMPLWRLQKLRGGREVAFLYRRGARRSEVRFEPGVVAMLAGYAPLIEQLVRAAWLRFVVRHNPTLLGTPATQLEEFLFPSDRAALDRFRAALLAVHGDRCFYCERALRVVHVDHFLPWSLYPRDLGHNFVLAHADCNQHKRDHLAAVEHLARWCERNDGDAALAAAFDRAGLPHDWPALRGAARSLYGIAAATAAPVWRAGREFVPLDGAWRCLLTA